MLESTIKRWSLKMLKYAQMYPSCHFNHVITTTLIILHKYETTRNIFHDLDVTMEFSFQSCVCKIVHSWKKDFRSFTTNSIMTNINIVVLGKTVHGCNRRLSCKITGTTKAEWVGRLQTDLRCSYNNVSVAAGKITGHQGFIVKDKNAIYLYCIRASCCLQCRCVLLTFLHWKYFITNLIPASLQM